MFKTQPLEGENDKNDFFPESSYQFYIHHPKLGKKNIHEGGILAQKSLTKANFSMAY